MNRISLSIIISIVVLIVVLLLGRLVLLAQVDKSIEEAKSEVKQLELARETIEAQLKKLKKTVVRLPKQNGNVLNPGEEAKVFKTILACSSKGFKFKSFEELKTYHVKGKEEQMANSSFSAGFNSGSQLPKLDAQGMPIGAVVEDDIEWPGVEILPIKFSFHTTFAGLGRFFSITKKKLPLHAVSNLDVILEDSGIVKGNIVYIFPETERK